MLRGDKELEELLGGTTRALEKKEGAMYDLLHGAATHLELASQLTKETRKEAPG